MEAVVSLPVFLLLACVLFQLFFLGLAQVQLQYAAFCGARAGVVHQADRTIIEKAVSRVMNGPFLLTPLRKGSFEVGISPNAGKDTARRVSQTPDPELVVDVRWNYPLIIPFADNIVNRFLPRVYGLGCPGVQLKATWTLPMEPGGGNYSRGRKDA